MTKSQTPIPNQAPMSNSPSGIGHFLLVWSLVLSPLSFSYGCTIGAFGPGATVDGRPILWKNRDVTNQDQEMMFFQGERYKYVTNVYAGDTANAWAGYNEVGFAIMNSNSFNIIDRNDGGADDGTIMKTALATCATVDDFGRLMDSLDSTSNGRTTPANFGVFDSTGMTAIFEASNLYYVRYNAQDESLGLLIRANYSMSGSPSRQTGRERWERAMELVVPARQRNRIDARFVIQTLTRDLGAKGFNPYPLPYEGRVGELPFGYLPTDSSLARHSTRSAEIMVGPRPGARTGSGMMWMVLGPPEVSLPVPVWVQAGPVPELLNGPERALFCDEAIQLHGYVHSDPTYPAAANTFRLRELYDSFASVESAIFALVESSEARWGPTGPTPEQARSVTLQACDSVLAAYINFWDYVNREAQIHRPDGRYGTWQNVTRDTIVLRFPPDARPGSAQVFDALGRKVAEMNLTPGQTVVTWEPSGLRSGNYFVVFPSGSGVRQLRFTYFR